MPIERQKCAVPICASVARRTIFGERYCFACAASVERAAYMGTLPTGSAERVLYRHTFPTSPPDGVVLPDPLVRPKSGWKSRR